MKRVAIIGGGIAGLSAAYYLQKARIDFTLFEGSGRFGGMIDSERTPEGFMVEAGPDSFLSAKPAASELARELGLGDELVPSNDAQRKTYILLEGRLVAIPDGMQLMVPTRSWPVMTSHLFTFSTKLRMAREFLFPPPPLAENVDESVASFVARHFGNEIVDRLANPLLAGVYGGDSSRLSVRAVLPMMVGSEAKHGSLVRGALRSGVTGKPAVPLFTTMRGGMRQLVDTLAARLPAECLRMKTPVTTITRTNASWNVAGESFTDIVLAVPAAVAATLLWPLDPVLSALLGKVTSTSCITVALGYGRAEELQLPPGFGFLVPRGEKKHLLACTFVHRKFDGRAPEGSALLRAFLTSGLEESDEAIIGKVRAELGEVLNIRQQPLMARVRRWPSAMPQYEVGHLERMKQIDERVGTLIGLRLTGNAYHGIGIPDCVRGGKGAAETIAASG
ncbi:MAG TPA: protoporphyrinogen oxidase [Terriglobales bacterium]|nr:protoporphyrinogen oxidase [Terriglobales bacterium]